MQELAQIKNYFLSIVPELTDEKWRLFEQVSTIRHIPKGTVIFRPGQMSNQVSFINYGLIRSYHLLDGKEFISAFFHEDCYFADYESFLSRKPVIQYSEALEDCEVVDLSYDDMQFLYNSLPEFDRAGRRIAEELFVLLSNRTDSFLLKTPEERYLELLEQFPTLPQRVPQYMIAAHLGITPEALSRIRARLSRRPLGEVRFVDSDQ